MESHNAPRKKLAATYSHPITANIYVRLTITEITSRLTSYTVQRQEPQWLESWRNVSPPMEFHSDNGPPFNFNEFSAFAAMYEFEHVTTSPEYPQSNGRVENAVKTSKDLMKKAASTNSDFQLALLDWRNTPTEGMKSSPGQRIFGRRTRTLLPTTRELLEPHLVRDVRERKLRRKEVQTRYFNRNGKKTSKSYRGWCCTRETASLRWKEQMDQGPGWTTRRR